MCKCLNGWFVTKSLLSGFNHCFVQGGRHRAQRSHRSEDLEHVRKGNLAELAVAILDRVVSLAALAVGGRNGEFWNSFFGFFF